MDYYCSHVLDLSEAFGHAVQQPGVVGPQKDTRGVESFVDDIDISTGPQKVLPQEVFPLRSSSEMMEKSVDRKTFLGPRG